MKASIVFVKYAGLVREGLARITLDIHGERGAATPRMLAAAAYRVAAKLEEFAGADGFDYSVSACKARLGIVELSYVLGGMDGDGMADDVAEEIAFDACAECDFYPADFLVEIGEIEVGK